jgi:hypothetical protein
VILVQCWFPGPGNPHWTKITQDWAGRYLDVERS